MASYHIICLYLCIIKLSSCADVCLMHVFQFVISVGVYITHEKVAACPRHKINHKKRSDSCDSLRILYHCSCVTTRDLYMR
ncbi:LOW QUALITY PROTEIN: defensin-like protein 316 [Eutrema salsugineum]|uniref:LOW QUALITY PROTEIN: defensin-like protein 316 n=1 Tax=Eutrema salsugineum TaxID=72664 RepID=UPI000CED3E49|nr:LOW QUALITY PROTEIN: defensin-like protein 316 [Eutrema salsugineum]